MGPGHEFDTIRLLMSRWGDLAVDIGDDAAVLVPEGSERRVVTTDACVENVHFRREWITPHEVGVRAAAAAISDVAAMGARAESVLIAMVVPDDWRAMLGEIADGIGRVVRRAGAKIIGGNMSRGTTLAITTTVIGRSAHVVSRRGARPGDVLAVTGRLGGPAAAIAAWTRGESPSEWARARFASPSPRLAEGAVLAAVGAHAMLDISDGLVADARHLAAASGVRLNIHATRVPRGEGVDIATALASGEEYELLAALPLEAMARIYLPWNAETTGPLTVIGTVEALPASEPIGPQSNAAEAHAHALVRVHGFYPPQSESNSTGNSTSRVEFVEGYDHFSQ